jgi:hypothetical protein
VAKKKKAKKKPATWEDILGLAREIMDDCNCDALVDTYYRAEKLAEMLEEMKEEHGLLESDATALEWDRKKLREMQRAAQVVSKELNEHLGRNQVRCEEKKKKGKSE